MVPVFPHGSRKMGELQFSNPSVLNYIFGFSVARRSFTCKKCFSSFGETLLWLEAKFVHLKII